MLAASGQSEFFRGLGIKGQNPRSQPLGINQFARTGNAREDFKIRIPGIGVVESPEGGLESHLVFRA